MSHRRAFTVIELVTAIAIVSILSAILFPVLSQTRTASYAGNGQRIAASVGMYLADHDYVFPVGCGCDGTHRNGGGWDYGIAPYLGNSWLARLHQNDDPDIRASWPTWVGAIGATNTSYAANGYMIQDETSNYGMYGVMGINQTKSGPGNCGFNGWATRGITAYSEVTHPADTVMIAEAFNGYQGFETSNIFTGKDWLDTTVGFGGLLPDPRRDGSPYIVNGVTQSADNRNGGLNALVDGKDKILWTDGHISMIAPVATNPDPTDESRNKWNAVRP
jgi:prepilin-type N-terminal cleavage/methylation domain-containing protein